jgi:ankyrin repeat protein
MSVFKVISYFICITVCILFFGGFIMSFLHPLSKDSWAFLNAADTGNVAEVNKILQKNPKLINITDRGRDFDGEFKTALIMATINGHTEVVRLLLSKGADMNKPAHFGFTPLWYAAEEGHLDIAKLLINKGANINAQDHMFHMTPLMRALSNNKDKLADLLIQKGANVNIHDREQESPLQLAVQYHYKEIAIHLIQHGAQVNAKNDHGATPFYYSANPEMAQFLIDHGALIISSSDSFTPLHYASFNGHTDLVQFYLEKGLNINASTKQGLTPLHLAVFNKHLSTAKLLLAKGADINCRTTARYDNIPANSTALSIALIKKDAPLAKLLRKNGGIE